MREEILTAAEQQLGEGGYNALNFGEIARDLDTTRANLHYHFKNKEGLAQACTARYIENNQAALFELAERYPGDFPGFFLELQQGAWKYLEAVHFQRTCVCVQVTSDSSEAPDPVRSIASDHISKTVDLYTELIEASQRAGNMTRDRDPRVLALEAWSLQCGFAQLLRSVPAEREPDASSRGLVNAWLEGLKPG